MTSSSTVQSVLDRINEIVTTTNTTEFIVRSFVDNSLLLTGSFDHWYYHQLEVRFHAVAYIGLQIHGLSSPRFSIATKDERKVHKHLQLEKTDILFSIHNDPDFHGGHRYFVAAESVEIVEGTVFYYWREDLKPGERIADWVKSKG